jgi:hypothetical protein
LHGVMHMGRPMLARWSSETPRRYVTVIRNPVDRILSEFDFWKDQCVTKGYTDAWPYQSCKAANKSQDHWLRSGYNTGLNRMTKYLSQIDHATVAEKHNCVSFVAGLQEKHWGQLYNNATWGGEGGLEDRINEDVSLLDNAKKVLDSHFFFVGLQDVFVESVELFGKIASNRKGGDVMSRGDLAHKSKGNKTISEETRQFILDKNRLDVELFNYIIDKFAAACEANGINCARASKLKIVRGVIDR